MPDVIEATRRTRDATETGHPEAKRTSCPEEGTVAARQSASTTSSTNRKSRLGGDLGLPRLSSNCLRNNCGQNGIRGLPGTIYVERPEHVHRQAIAPMVCEGQQIAGKLRGGVDGGGRKRMVFG